MILTVYNLMFKHLYVFYKILHAKRIMKFYKITKIKLTKMPAKAGISKMEVTAFNYSSRSFAKSFKISMYNQQMVTNRQKAL